MAEPSSPDIPQGPKGNRRWFVGLFGKGAIVAAASQIPGVLEPSTAHATPLPPTGQKVEAQPIADQGDMDEIVYKPEVIDGIEIYGVNELLNTTESVQQLYSHFQRGFQSQVKARLTHDQRIEDLDHWQQRELVLNPDTRLLQLYVKRTIYEKFKTEAQTTEVDLPRWLNMHIDRLNRFIDETPGPDVNLHCKLSRIIVVDDSFDDRLDVHQEIPDTPNDDVDANWEMWHDYRGDIAPGKTQLEKSAFTREEVVDGKNVIIDYGLTHEWSHMLLTLPDEYVQLLPQLNDAPAFYLEHCERNETWTPWAKYYLAEVKRRGIRGYYTDPLALGVAGHIANITESVGNMWSLHPDSSVLRFVDQDDKPIQGVVEFNTIRSHFYYENKYPVLSDTQDLTEGSVTINPDIFTPEFSGHDVTHPTNWIITITRPNGVKDYLHLPVAVFNMSRLAGKNEANYNIKLHQDSGFLNPNITQFATFTPNVYPSGITGDDITKYASMSIDGTPFELEWFMPQ